MILKHLPLFVIVGSGIYFYGGLVNTVASHTEQLASYSQMRVDIGVIKAQLDWLVARAKQQEARTLRK
jgi:hypothetical protein